MATSLDEAMRDAYEQKHLHDAEVICECGEAWTIRCIDGEPKELDALRCSVCDGEGEIQ